MRKSTSYIILASAVITIGFVAIDQYKNKNEHYSTRKESNAKQAFAGAAEFYHQVRHNPLTGRVSAADVYAAQRALTNMGNTSNKTASLGMVWQEIGPDNVGGRTRAILIDNLDPTGNTLYAGGISGGLWRSVNAGNSWFKFKGFPSNDTAFCQTVSCISQASNGDIYIGTGEYSNSPQGDFGSEFMGGGLYKMSSGSSQFSRLMSTRPNDLANASDEWATVQEIAVSPLNPNLVYAATNTGLRRSDDGGLTWTNPVYNTVATYDANGMIDKEGGITTTPLTTAKNRGFADDVDIASDGTVIAAVGRHGFISPNGDDNTFVDMSVFDESTNLKPVVKGKNKLPKADVCRIEFAIAPSNSNYIYALASAAGSAPTPIATTGIPATQYGGLKNVYRSTDKGLTWTVIGQGGSVLFEPFGGQTQGWYDNCIAVNPGNPNQIIFGGIEYYAWINGGNCYQISSWISRSPSYPYYVHADAQTIAWSKTNSDICYFGCDGGVFKTLIASNPNPTFISCNRGYNVTQFYGLAYAKDGEVMAGAQDNGTQYIDFVGGGYSPTAFSAREVRGGDGFLCEISQISPKGFFATIYSADVQRSSNSGESFSPFWDANTATAAGNTGVFRTTVRLWESFNNENSYDSIPFVIPAGGITAGTKVVLASKTANYPFTYIFDTDYPAGETIAIQDRVQARFVTQLASPIGGIALCNDPLDYFKAGNWMRIASTAGVGSTVIDLDGNTIPPVSNDFFTGNILSYNFSKDGNYLFFVTTSGGVYVVKNLNGIKKNSQVFYPATHPAHNRDKATGEIGNAKSPLQCRQLGVFNATGDGSPTDVAVDPSNPNHIVVTLGNYGINKHVYRCSDATTAPRSSTKSNFTDITNNLPPIPVYSAIIDYQNPEKIVLGTEYGIFGSNDDGATWVEENGGMERVPVHMVRQQTQPWGKVSYSGALYIATHGRGVFKSNTLLGLEEKPMVTKKAAILNQVFPNPVMDQSSFEFSVEKTKEVTVKIYDMNGRIVREDKLGTLKPGNQKYTIQKSKMTAGMYIITVDAGEEMEVSKFIIAE